MLNYQGGYVGKPLKTFFHTLEKFIIIPLKRSQLYGDVVHFQTDPDVIRNIWIKSEPIIHIYTLLYHTL